MKNIISIQGLNENVAAMLCRMVGAGIPFIQVNRTHGSRRSKYIVKDWMESTGRDLCYIRIREKDIPLVVLLNTTCMVIECTNSWKTYYQPAYMRIKRRNL